jgi:hypothetical protein
MARYETLGAISSEIGTVAGAGGDGSLVTIAVIIVALVVLAFVGYFMYTKFGSKIFRGGGKSEGDEEAADEELY